MTGLGLNDPWLITVIGAGFVFSSGGYLFTWRVLSMLTKSKDEAKDASSKQHETTQKTVSGFTARAERLIGELRSESASARAQLQGEMAAHALKDSDTFATKKDVGEALGEVRVALRAIDSKLDRVIERNIQVDRP